MSLYTIAGLLVGIGLFLWAALSGADNKMIFIQPASLLLVVGGTMANAFMSYQGRYVVQAFKDVGKMFGHAKVNQDQMFRESRRVISWSELVQKDGILALEARLKSKEASDNFLQTGIQLVVDGSKPGEVRDVLGNMLQSEFQRINREVNILKGMASTAPAFGMIGTLVGLIIMLEGLGANTSGADGAGQLGIGMATALLTTLYGILLARFVFQPAADKTLQRAKIARFRNFLLMEGFVMISEERSPRFVEARINSFLDPGQVQTRKGGRSAA